VVRLVRKGDVTVVIPTLNERDGIVEVIRELRQHGYSNILVIDGYSDDGTAEIAEKVGAKVVKQHGFGKTAAIKTAIDLVNTPYMLVMDGDYTYDPKDIENFLPHMEYYDQVIGARVSGKKNIPRFNRFGNWLITKTFNVLFGANLSDVCSGMYMLKSKVAKDLELSSNGFSVEVEIAAQTAARRKVEEVPINYRSRIGRKKLSSLKDGFQIFRSVIKLARKHNPVLLYSSLAALSGIPALLILAWTLLNFVYTGNWHSGLALLGTLLLLLSTQAITLSIISVLLKRMENRISLRH